MTSKMRENAYKVTYLVKLYPEKILDDVIEDGEIKEQGIISLLQVPAIDANCAIWTAIRHGWISEPDEKTKKISLLKEPEEWEFGKDVEDLETSIHFAFNELAKKETDLEEHYMGIWTQGYPPRDYIIALSHLMDRGIMTRYVIEDGENAYTFYTLTKNKDYLWGKKQFKKDPLPPKSKKKK